ncbi:MAG: hypothetical protein LIP06_10505, partial [Tannerellaceae bacterium]|nr:hypothetical protein [Tannerellaceae bacterium]
KYSDQNLSARLSFFDRHPISLYLYLIFIKNIYIYIFINGAVSGAVPGAVRDVVPGAVNGHR